MGQFALYLDCDMWPNLQLSYVGQLYLILPILYWANPKDKIEPIEKPIQQSIALVMQNVLFRST